MNPFVLLSGSDSVVVASRELRSGTEFSVAGTMVKAQQDIGLGHKMAIRPIASGSPVMKYGQPIGQAIQDIAIGEWVHSHNLRNQDLAKDYEFATVVPAAPKPIERTFMGYGRKDGRSGTRNYIAIISNVNCSASVSKYVARHFTPDRLAAYPNVDGVVAFTHHGGCAMQFAGQQHQLLNRFLV